MLNVFPLTKTENPSMGIQQPAQGVGVAQECVPLGAAVPTPPVRNGNATVHRAENGFSCFAKQCNQSHSSCPFPAWSEPTNWK